MGLNRRNFIMSSAAVLGAGAPAKPARRVAANDKINFGFIGFGKRGNELRRSFETFPEVNMVAVADLYDGYLQNAREVINDNIQTTKDYRVILERKDIDAVVIATPEHWHTPQVLDALSAGKDIYCEKPMNFTVEEGYRIMEAARKSDRILQIGSQMKTSAVTAKAREIIKSGVLGKLNCVMSNMGRNSLDGAWVYPIPPDASPQTVDWQRFLGSTRKLPFDKERFFHWRNYWEYSGGIATDLYVHSLTSLHEILDVKLPKSAVSLGGNYRWHDGRTVPDIQTAIWEYPGDYQVVTGANLGCSKVGQFMRGTAFMGSEAMMLMGGPDGAIAIYREDPNAVQWQAPGPLPRKWREHFLEERKKLAALPKPQPVEVIEVPRENDPNKHMRLFVESIKNRTPSVENAEEGHNAATAAMMANYAVRNNCRATIDPKSGKLRAL